jgi:hypothetical protein
MAMMSWPRAGASHAFAASMRGAVLPTFHVPTYTDILCVSSSNSPCPDARDLGASSC